MAMQEANKLWLPLPMKLCMVAAASCCGQSSTLSFHFSLLVDTFLLATLRSPELGPPAILATIDETPLRTYVVPAGRVVVPTGRYVVPAGKVIIIVSPSRLNLVPTSRILCPGSDNESDDASVHSEATIPQQQRNIQPQIITTVSNNNAKFPYLKKDEYEFWAMKMQYWITNNDMNIWKVVQNSNSLKRTGRDRDGRVIILPPTTADEH
ncbi:hypothetical protein Tco_1107347, partial [Tanacetum coccineum]